MKEKIKNLLKKFPFFYLLAQRIWWGISMLKVKILGTRVIEKKWQRNKKNRDFSNLNYPHRQFLIKRISNFQPFGKILEIGCDYGPNLYLLAKKFPRVKFTGIDINPLAIKEGRKWFEKEGLTNIELLVGKADELSKFLDKSFDIVFTDAVLMYIGQDKIKKLITETARIAKMVLIFIEWHLPDKRKELYDSHIGVWKRDYLNLFKKYFLQEKINISKIPKELWPDENWQKFGYIIEIKL